MRVTLTRLFELARIPEKLREVSPLVEWLNEAHDQFVKAFQNGLTLRDNARAEIREFSLTDGKAVTFSPARREVEGVIPLRTTSTDRDGLGNPNGLSGFTWEWNAKDQMSIVGHTRIPGKVVKVSVCILFQ